MRAVVVIYAARVLGASQWGVFSYALSLAALFTIFADIGLGAALTRELVKSPERRDEFLSASLAIKAALLLFVSLIVIFASPYLTKIIIPQTLIILTALLVVFDSLRSFAFSIVRTMEKMHIEALVNIVTQASIVALGLWILTTKPSIEYLAGAYVAASAFGFILVSWIIRNYFKKIFFGFDRQLIKKIIVSAWPFALLGLMGSVMLNTDIIMLGWFRSANDIGYYSVGQKIIFVLYVLPAVISTAAFPALTRLASQQKKGEFAELLVKTIKTTLIIALPVAVGGIIVAPKLINLLFGPEYQAAVTAFRILLASLVINYPSTVLGNALFAYDQQKQFIKYAAIGAGGNIVFNLALIPYWGVEGAAVSTLFTQIISNYFVWQKMRRINYFNMGGHLIKAIIATIIMAVQVWTFAWFNVNLPLVIVSGALIYLLVLLLVKEPALT